MGDFAAYANSKLGYRKLQKCFPLGALSQEGEVCKLNIEGY
jgi:hypothetical protein